MSYKFSGWQRADDSNSLLGKILNLLGAVAKGDTGWLVRGNISTAAQQTSSAPSNASIITVAADIALAAGEKLFVQNLGTNPLFVRRATGATSAAFHYELVAGVANDDGTGGSLVIDDHIGVVSFAGTSVRYNAWKI